MSARTALVADVLFAEDSNLVQETVVKEAASMRNMLDASVRAALTDAIDASHAIITAQIVRGGGRRRRCGRRSQDLRNLPGPARAALLP